MEGGPGQEGEEERYLRQVMGIVEEQEWTKERQRVKRVKKKSACKEAKPGVEVEDVPQGARAVTKVSLPSFTPLSPRWSSSSPSAFASPPPWWCSQTTRVRTPCPSDTW